MRGVHNGCRQRSSQTLDLSKCGEVRADVWMFEKAHNIGTYFFSRSSGVNMIKEWAEDDILMVTKLVEFPAPYTWWRSHFWTFPHFVSWADCSYCQGCCSLPLSTFLFTRPVHQIMGIETMDCRLGLWLGFGGCIPWFPEPPQLHSCCFYNDNYDNWFGFPL